MDTTPEQIENSIEAELADAVANKRAAQILAEMLGLVCHQEYIACGDQMVPTFLRDKTHEQLFVIQIAGLDVSIWWAEFPSRYLDTIRNHNLRDLKNLAKVILRHTRPQSLLVPDERDRFLRDYVSVVHFVASGYSNVGFLRRDGETPIHRDIDDVVESDIVTDTDDIVDSDSFTDTDDGADF